MAVITSYETLQTAVGDYLARNDLTTFVPNFVQNFEERFYRQPMNWGPWMESLLSFTTVGGVGTVPSDYLGLKHAYLSVAPTSGLDRLSAQALYAKYPRGGTTGRPRFIARDRGTFVFGPSPDSDYAVLGTYYAKPSLIRNDSDGVNWLTTNAPDLMLYGSLMEAAPFLKDDGRIAVWRDFYSDALADYRDLIRDEDRSGAPLAMVLA